MARDVMQTHGDQKYLEAHQWWLAHDFALYRYRNWMLIWMLRKRMFLHLRQRNVSIHRLAYIELQIAAAHDRMIIEGENVRTTARCASACEMAGRIYHEEHEGRETNNQNQNDNV